MPGHFLEEGKEKAKKEGGSGQQNIYTAYWLYYWLIVFDFLSLQFTVGEYATEIGILQF